MLHQTALIALFLAACSSHVAQAPVATAVPEPREIDTTGFQDAMRAQRGHPVIVNFWATWCTPCIQEFPDVVKGAQKWRARGVRFVSISADDPKDLANVKRTLQKFGAPFDAVLIASAKAGPALIEGVDADWSGALPTTFLYDANGARRERRVGAIDETLLVKWLEPMLK
jgi:thiol-disulfide isomerase/thioredoxin